MMTTNALETLAEARTRGGDEAVRALVMAAVARVVAGELAGDVGKSYGSSADALRRAAARVGVAWPTLARGAAYGSVAYGRAMKARAERAKTSTGKTKRGIVTNTKRGR